MKMFVLYMRNISFIFIILYLLSNSTVKASVCVCGGGEMLFNELNPSPFPQVRAKNFQI